MVSDVFGRIDGAAKNNTAISQYSRFHQDLAGLDFLTDLFTRMKLGMDQVFNSDILFAITLLNFCKAKKEKKNFIQMYVFTIYFVVFLLVYMDLIYLRHHFFGRFSFL